MSGIQGHQTGLILISGRPASGRLAWSTLAAASGGRPLTMAFARSASTVRTTFRLPRDQAAETLRREGKSVEVLDLRSLVPLDFDAIAASVKKTSRVLVVHEDKVHGGFGGELVARIASELFAFLDAPVDRVGSTFTPVGFNRILERAILPNTEKVLEAAKKTLAY